MRQNPKQFLTELLRTAIHAAQPEHLMAQYLPTPPKGHVVIIGAGKAAANMAYGFEKAWLQTYGIQHPLSGAVIIPYHYRRDIRCQNIEIYEAAHPVPDQNGLKATQKLLQKLAGLTHDDLVIALISGGGSALLPAPAGNLTLADEIAVNRILLSSGMPIGEMNIVRKAISTVKGGKLAIRIRPAKCLTLIISDIPGDNPALVASGPTLKSNSSPSDALDLIHKYQLILPQTVINHIESAARQSPSDFDRAHDSENDHEVKIIASAQISLKSAALKARDHAIDSFILSDRFEGDAIQMAFAHAAIAQQIHTYNQPFEKPVILLSGGETSVKVENDAGRGGRNTTFALALSLALQHQHQIYAVSADSDGIDGKGDHAGAYCDCTTVMRLQQKGLNAAHFLQTQTTYDAFAALDDLIITGPTGTNVNDFRAIMLL